MRDEPVGEVLPDTREAPLDEGEEETPIPELEQVAQDTSRKLLTLLAVGAALLLVIHATPFGDQVRNWDALAELFKAGGLKAEIYFVLISSFLIMLGTPRLLFCALGGFAFGFWEGTFWSLSSNLIGSFLAFKAARWGGKAWLTERFGQRRFFARIVHAKPTISSIGLALSHVGNRAFLLGSLIGFMPQGIVAVIIGSGMAEEVPWAGAAQIGVAGVLLLAILFWASRKRRKMT